MTPGPSRGFFDVWSRFYDLPLVQAATYRPLHDAIVRALARRAHGSILDVGCGTGQLVTRLGAIAETTRVVGVDFSAGMLERASARLRSTAEPYRAAVQLVRADAARLPLPDHAFDAVVSTEAFHWFPDQAACLREMHRVLAPGGCLLLALVSPRFPLVGAGVEVATRLVGQTSALAAARRAARAARGDGLRGRAPASRVPHPGFLAAAGPHRGAQPLARTHAHRGRDR